MKILLFLFPLFALADDGLPKKLSLMPTRCALSGDYMGSVRTTEGELTILNCEIEGKVMRCAQIERPKEDYEILAHEKGTFVAKSDMGNVNFIGDMNTRSYSIGSSHLVPGVGIMTKHCAGRIETPI